MQKGGITVAGQGSRAVRGCAQMGEVRGPDTSGWSVWRSAAIDAAHILRYPSRLFNNTHNLSYSYVTVAVTAA